MKFKNTFLVEMSIASITLHAIIRARPKPIHSLSVTHDPSVIGASYVSASSSLLLLRFAPAIFVAIWSTGWVSARFGADNSDPLTFLAVRFLLALFAMTGLAFYVRATWPRQRIDWVHAMVSGVLMHAIYLGGVWWAISRGVPAGISGLVAAVQPIMTALLAPIILREKISQKQWIGIAAGFFGIALVLEPKLAAIGADRLISTIEPLAINVLAMISVTLGTFYQKKFIPTGDLRSVTALQYAGAFIVMMPAAYFLEPMRIEWNVTLVLVMIWSVLALSLGAIGLLLLLIRRGAVSRAAALIYLVPPSVAIEAYFVFDETLSVLQIVGMGFTALGVALAVSRK